MPAPSATWSVKRVHATYRNRQTLAMEGGSWTTVATGRIVNTLADGSKQIFRAGPIASGTLAMVEGQPSIDIELPVTDDPDNSPQGGAVTLTIVFASGGTEVYQISPLMSWPDGTVGGSGGTDLATLLDPATIPSAPTYAMVGVPGGVARLDSDGDVTDAVGNKIAGVRPESYDPDAGEAGHDSTSALQSAITDSEINGWAVQLSPGKVYEISSPLILNASVNTPAVIIGHRTTWITAIAGFTGYMLDQSSGAGMTEDISLLDLNLNGSLLATGCVRIRNAHRACIEGGWWKNVTTTVGHFGGTHVYECSMRRTRLSGIQPQPGELPSLMPAKGLNWDANDSWLSELVVNNCQELVTISRGGNFVAGLHVFGYPYKTATETRDFLATTGVRVTGMSNTIVGTYLDTQKVGVLVQAANTILSGTRIYLPADWTPTLVSAIRAIDVDISSGASGRIDSVVTSGIPAGVTTGGSACFVTGTQTSAISINGVMLDQSGAGGSWTTAAPLNKVTATDHTASATGVSVPAGVTGAWVHLIAGGGGGGSGRRGAAGTVRCGGGGGGHGGFLREFVPIALLGTTYTVTVATAAGGGAAVTTDSTDGSAGAAGGITTFASASLTLVAYQGSGGAGGTATNGLGGASRGPNGSTNGASASATGGPGATPAEDAGGPAPGSSGGGITSGDVEGAGAAGGICRQAPAATAGSAGVVGGAAPTSGVAVAGLPTYGPGSGAASKTAAAQAGANAAAYGAGGAGGGASLNGFNSGAGGSGGPGFVRIIWTY